MLVRHANLAHISGRKPQIMLIQVLFMVLLYGQQARYPAPEQHQLDFMVTRHTMEGRGVNKIQIIITSNGFHAYDCRL